MNDFIVTATGRRFYPLAPREGDIEIEDIAHALSLQCRFAGHTRYFYSVGEHSARVADLLEAWGQSQEVVLWGLLHDASEASLVDIPSPLKAQPAFAPYLKAERRLKSMIVEHFGLSCLEPQAVRDADRVLLATEARDLMPGHDYQDENGEWVRTRNWNGLPAPLPEALCPVSADAAKVKFMQRFMEVST